MIFVFGFMLKNNLKCFLPIRSDRHSDSVIDEDFFVRTNISDRDDRTNQSESGMFES